MMHMSDNRTHVSVGADKESVFVKVSKDLLPTAGVVAGAMTLAKAVKGGPLIKVGTFAAAIAAGQAGLSVGNAIQKLTSTETVNSVVLSQQSTSKVIENVKMELTNNSTNVPSSNNLDTPFSWIYHHLPQWIKEDIIARVPHTLENAEGTYQVLFLKYNLILYGMYLSIFFLLLSLLIIGIFLLFLKYRSYLVLQYPRTLGRVVKNQSTIKLGIYFNIFGAFLNLCVILQGICYLKVNYIPHDLGSICDAAISSLS